MTVEPTVTASEDLPDGVASCTVSSDGVIEYWDDQGCHHNPAGPAVITPDRGTYWLVTGEDPSNVSDGWWFNQRSWFRHGLWHRTDGPAVEYGDGRVEYWVTDWVDGQDDANSGWVSFHLTEDEFHQRYPAPPGQPATDSRI